MLVRSDRGDQGNMAKPRSDLDRGRAELPATTRLGGWGGNLSADCVLVEPETPSEVLARLDRRGTIARGLGRSYGDAAINAAGQVLGMTRVDRYLGFDDGTGML